MIINEKELIFSPFIDPRGGYGMSGPLKLGKHKNGVVYLIKSLRTEIANEYVAHGLAKLINVPTSDAVLVLRRKELTGVGIVYEQDFQRINLDSFLGLAEYKKDRISTSMGGKPCIPPTITELMYPDDSPLLADVMRYLAFRRMIVLEDNPQIAVSQGRVISFDYAESFRITPVSYDMMLSMGKVDMAVENFLQYLSLKKSYESALNILRRPDTPFLRAAYYEPFYNFSMVDKELILSDLDEVYPPVVANFYYNCFEYIQEQINELTI